MEQKGESKKQTMGFCLHFWGPDDKQGGRVRGVKRGEFACKTLESQEGGLADRGKGELDEVGKVRRKKRKGETNNVQEAIRECGRD